MRPPAFRLSRLRASCLSAVWAPRSAGVARTPDRPAPAGDVSPGHVHRARAVAPDHPLQPATDARHPVPRKRGGDAGCCRHQAARRTRAPVRTPHLEPPASRQLVYHPHIHYIVPGVALRKDGILVTPKDPDYLLCVDVLSVRMRTRFERALRERDPALFHQIGPSVWRKAWVVHSEPVGCGEHALKYLSRYIYRTAISTERHLEESNGSVSFRYKDSKTREQKTAVLPVLVFLAMFLQHVLPKRFRRVRAYGWQSPAAKNKFARIHALLDALPACVTATVPKEAVVICCPKCRKPMRLIGTFGRGPPR